jgi:hypothetical protein
VGVLSTLRQDKAGDWPSLLDFLREARHRESRAVAALGHVLAAPLAEQRELAESPDAGPVLLELACDLRVSRTARLACARCLLEAGIEPPYVGQLFAGAGDLVTDPRLGGAARKLVEAGLPSAVVRGAAAESVSLEAGSFARGVVAAASAVGADRVKELLAAAPSFHAGAMAGLFALGSGELPPTQREQWKKLLADTCAAHRRAPAAARRIGLAPPWPPNLPEAFAPLVKAAEESAAGVTSADAAATPETLRKPPAAGEVAVRSGRPASPPDLPAPRLPEGKTLAPPIRRSGFRQPSSKPGEPRRSPEPTRLPPKPMEEVKARPRAQADPQPAPARPRLPPPAELPARAPSVPVPPRREADVRFDPRGRRIPRSDRWSDDAFQWQEPLLPPPVLPSPPKARVASGPFTERVAALFEDRPEALERLCAAAEAHAARSGDGQLLRALTQELSSKRWVDRKPPPALLTRLRAIASDERHPPAWGVAARCLLDRLG